jgi:predicted MFS family arabinose efflux permease
VIMILMPLVGFLTDRFGVRPVAAVGMIAFPLCNLFYSQMSGDIETYFAIFIAQTVLSCSTTATIYTRLIAQNFDRWRGIALGICAIGPSLFGLFGSPMIASFVAEHGWRNGFMAVAAYSALCGLITFLLIGRAEPEEAQAARPERPGNLAVLKQAALSPMFWIFAVGAFLVSAHHALFTLSLKLVILEQGVTDLEAAWLIALFSFAAIAGRIVSGFALDLIRPNRVAAFFLGLPVIGLLLLASGEDGQMMIALAIGLVGLAYGGEGDIIGYLISRLFGIEVFSTIMGFITAAIAAAIAGGSMLLSAMLGGSGSFTPFLTASAVCVAIGALMMLSLGRYLGDAAEGA